jgi:cytochrome c
MTTIHFEARFRGKPMITRRKTCCAAALLAAMLLPDIAAAQDAAAGERLFRQRCGSCHTVQPGQNRVGPTLAGIVGQRAGSVQGARYSPGLRDLGVTWDAGRLNSFLANPRAMVPGTTMTVSVPNDADRASIVAYLQALATSN